MLGFTRAVWSTHPQLAVLFLTIAVTLGLRYVWSEPQERMKHRIGQEPRDF